MPYNDNVVAKKVFQEVGKAKGIYIMTKKLIACSVMLTSLTMAMPALAETTSTTSADMAVAIVSDSANSVSAAIGN